VLYFNDEEGLAVVSGGKPTLQTPTGCRFEKVTNGSGLWIFTRA